MSMEAIKDFFDRVAENPDLKGKVETALEDRGTAAAFEIVDIAAAEGQSFTATELRDWVAGESGEGELSEEQMAAVAGGLRLLRVRLPRLRKLRRLSTTELRRARARKTQLDT